MKLAASIEDIFGKINPPGPAGLNKVDPGLGLSRLIVTSLRIFLIVAGLALLIYLLSGAYDWIVSEGDKEKLSKARAKISNAVIGILVLVVCLLVFILVAGNILGIIIPTGGGFRIKIPTLE